MSQVPSEPSSVEEAPVLLEPSEPSKPNSVSQAAEQTMPSSVASSEASSVQDGPISVNADDESQICDQKTAELKKTSGKSKSMRASHVDSKQEGLRRQQIRELLKDVTIFDFGVLGYQMSSGQCQLKADHPDETMAFLDIVGLRGEDADFKPSVCELLHGCRLAFDQGSKRDGKEGLAIANPYGNTYAIHVDVLDFRGWTGSMEEAITAAAEIYHAALVEFAGMFASESAVTKLRLAPLGEGLFSGQFSSDIPTITWQALWQALYVMSEDKFALLKFSELDVCIFQEAHLSDYVSQFEKIVAFRVDKDEVAKARGHYRELAAGWSKNDRSWLPLRAASPHFLASNWIGGQGVYFYFQFAHTNLRLLALLVFLATPYIILNSLGDALGKTFGSGTFSRTTISNLGTADDRHVYELNIRDITFWISVVEALITVIVYLTNLWLEKFFLPQFGLQNISAENFAVFVDCLPRRLPGHPQEDYAGRLRRHFEDLLLAVLPVDGPGHIRNKLYVVAKDDEGISEPEPHWFGLDWMPQRHRHVGRDLRRRRLGDLIGISDKKRAFVRWHSLSGEKGDGILEDYDPTDLFDQEQLQELEEESLGYSDRDQSVQLVHEVALVEDFDQKLSRKIELFSKLELERERSNNPEARQKILLKQAKSQIEQTEEQPDVLGAYVVFERTCDMEFIFGQYSLSRTIFRCFMHPRLTFEGCNIRVREAPLPADIFWPNMDFPHWKRQVRVKLVALIGFILVVICTTLIAVAQSMSKDVEQGLRANCATNNLAASSTNVTQPLNVSQPLKCMCAEKGLYAVYYDEPKGINAQCTEWLEEFLWANGFKAGVIIFAAGTNVIMTTTILLLGHIWKPTSLSQLDRSIYRLTTIYMTLNPVGIILASSYSLPSWIPIPWWSPFGKGLYKSPSPQWYLDVGDLVGLSLLIYAVQIPLSQLGLPVVQAVLRRCCRHRKRTKTELLQLYEPDPFMFAIRSAQTTVITFLCVTLSCLMPILWAVLAIYFALSYGTDVLILLRFSREPPEYDQRLALDFVRVIQFAAMCRAYLSIFVFADQDAAPSYDFDVNVSYGEEWLEHMRNNGNPLILYSTLPQLFCFGAIFTHYLFFVLHYFLKSFFGSTVITIRHMLLGSRPKNSASSPFWGRVHSVIERLCGIKGLRSKEEEAAEQTFAEMKEEQAVRSYDMRERPEYAFMKGSAIDNVPSDVGERIKAKVMKRIQLDDSDDEPEKKGMKKFKAVGTINRLFAKRNEPELVTDKE